MMGTLPETFIRDPRVSNLHDQASLLLLSTLTCVALVSVILWKCNCKAIGVLEFVLASPFCRLTWGFSSCGTPFSLW